MKIWKCVDSLLIQYFIFRNDNIIKWEKKFTTFHFDSSNLI
jgi:hypothetical protein